MGAKILIVDDEILVLRSLERFLRKAGYDVTAVSDGAQAVDAVKRADYDLVVSDIKMPRQNGFEVIQEIRSILAKDRRRKVPEIFITGYADAETAKQVEGLKAAEYVYKPFDLRAFLDLVEKHVPK